MTTPTPAAVERYEDSPFIKALSIVYQAASNSAAKYNREQLIEGALSSITGIRGREIDNGGNKLTWDDAALRWFEGFKETIYKENLSEEEEEGLRFTMDEWLYVVRHERADKKEGREGEEE